MVTPEALGFGTQLESLRSSAKWLITGAASVGVVAVAGLQLPLIVWLPLSSWRPYAAILAVLATLLMAAYVIRLASSVLTHEWLSLSAFTFETMNLPGQSSDSPIPADQRKLIEDKLEAAQDELFGHVATSVADLHRRLHELNARLTDLDGEARSKAAERSAELRGVASAVVQYANYQSTLYLFKRMCRRLVWAAAVWVAGVLLFAYAVSQPRTPNQPVEVRIVSSHQGHVPLPRCRV